MKLVYDIETDGLDATVIWCLVIYNLETDKIYKYSDHDHRLPGIMDGVAMLTNADVIIGHNIIGFDIPMIKKVYPFFEPKGRVIDTLLLSRLYHPDMLEVDRKARIDGMPPKLYGRHSLESYGHRLGEYKGNFGQTSDWSAWSKEMEDYCEQDVIVTNKLCQHFHPYLSGYN